MADKVTDVYGLIADKGYFADEKEFRSYVSDPNKIKEVYSLIKDDGFFTDEKEFNSYFQDSQKKSRNVTTNGANVVTSKDGEPQLEPSTVSGTRVEYELVDGEVSKYDNRNIQYNKSKNQWVITDDDKKGDGYFSKEAADAVSRYVQSSKRQAIKEATAIHRKKMESGSFENISDTVSKKTFGFDFKKLVVFFHPGTSLSTGSSIVIP